MQIIKRRYLDNETMKIGNQTINGSMQASSNSNNRIVLRITNSDEEVLICLDKAESDTIKDFLQDKPTVINIDTLNTGKEFPF